MKVGIAVGIVTAVAALVVCLAPLKTVPYTVMVDYEDIETYYETEPYEVTETYYETQPIAYEVVESHTDTESYKERRRIVVGGTVFQDEIVDVFYPVGYVTVKNTDTVDGTFGILFTFYTLDKLTIAIAAQELPDFSFEDYFIAEDPYSYLASLNWDNLDWDKVMIFCEQYNGHRNTTLQPSEIATVSYSVKDIDIDSMPWKWQYTIVEPTKEVEKERTVTKYRQVENQRTVTRQRQETRYKKVTLLDYILHY